MFNSVLYCICRLLTTLGKCGEGHIAVPPSVPQEPHAVIVMLQWGAGTAPGVSVLVRQFSTSISP